MWRGWPRVGAVKDSARARATDWGARFLIVPDSMLTKDWVYDGLERLDIGLLAVDEASRFKDPEAAREIVRRKGGHRGAQVARRTQGAAGQDVAGAQAEEHEEWCRDGENGGEEAGILLDRLGRAPRDDAEAGVRAQRRDRRSVEASGLDVLVPVI